MTQRGESAGSRKSYGHPCLIAQALDLLGDRWTLLIVRDLMSGLHRYSEILENCGGMSPNVLSDRLKRLEAEGLVVRDYERGLPPRVEYSLTEKGWAVRPILLSLLDYSRIHLLDEWESLVDEMPVDFVVRVVPTFAFQPVHARDFEAMLAVEIAGQGESNRWTFQIKDGNLHPRRNGEGTPDVTLRTTQAGFLKFVRCEAPAEDCGALSGSAPVARAVQECFAQTAG